MERLPLAEPIVALHEAREGHLRASLCVGLESHGVFGVLLVGDGEDQRLFVIHLFLDPPFGDREVLEVSFKHLLSGIRRQIEALRQTTAEGREELSEGQQVLSHADNLAMNSAKQMRFVWHRFEQAEDQFGSEGLDLPIADLPASDDLVVDDVEEHRGLEGHCVDEVLCEDLTQKMRHAMPYCSDPVVEVGSWRASTSLCSAALRFSRAL